MHELGADGTDLPFPPDGGLMPSQTVTRPGALVRLATWSIDRRRTVVALWLALLIGLGVLSSVAGGEYDIEFRTPGAESDDAQRLLEEHFPARSGDTVDVVFRAGAGAADPTVRAEVEALLADLAVLPRVTGVQSPYDPAFGYQISPLDPTIAYASLLLDGTSEDLPNSLADAMVEATEAAEASGDAVDFELSGFLIQQSQQGEMGSEGIGLLAAAFILLLTFGSVLAMGLPILVAVFGLGDLHQPDRLDRQRRPGSRLRAARGDDDRDRRRHRLHAVHRHAVPHRAADRRRAPTRPRWRSIATAGRAVLFAGCTVCISVFGLSRHGSRVPRRSRARRRRRACSS